MTSLNSQRAGAILNEAARLVTQDRNATHGDCYQQQATAAKLWTAWLQAKDVTVEISAEDVAVMMMLLKLSRTISGGTFNPDNYVDMAGYAGIASACAAKENDK